MIRETAVSLDATTPFCPKLIDMETPTASHRQIANLTGLRNILSMFVLSLAFLPSIGCRICTDSEDLAYPAYGGAWERTIRDQGRVGSLFDPGGAQAATLVSKDEPLSPDEIQRKNEASKDDRSNENDDDLDPFSDESRDDKAQDDGAKSGENDSMKLDSLPNRDDQDALDKELQRRRKELQDMELQDIQVIPGEPLPPIL